MLLHLYVGEMELLNVKGIALGVAGNVLYMDGSKLGYKARTLIEMKNVLFDPKIIDNSNMHDQIYFMFRGVGAEKNKGLFKEHALSYDITIIPAYELGKEFNKTLGHYHPEAEKGLSYPEFYEILRGCGLVLLQKRLGRGTFDIRVVHVNAGDTVLIPPNYGHITINTGFGSLVMANLVSINFESDYKSIEKMHGGAIYALANGAYMINKNYRKIRLSEENTAPRMGFLKKGKSIYDAFIERPEKFAFLNKPRLMERNAGLGRRRR